MVQILTYQLAVKGFAMNFLLLKILVPLHLLFFSVKKVQTLLSYSFKFITTIHEISIQLTNIVKTRK